MVNASKGNQAAKASKAAKARQSALPSFTQLGPMAQLYEMWTMDVLPSIGVECAMQFRANPERFGSVNARTATTLGELEFTTGVSPSYLSDPQRKSMMSAVLGASDGMGMAMPEQGFGRAAQALRDAATAYSERKYDTSHEQLRQAFRSASTTLQSYLTAVAGAVATDALTRLSKHHVAVVRVLSDSQFAAGMGYETKLPQAWPHDLKVDGKASMLVDALWQMRKGRDASMANASVGAVQGSGGDWFQHVQRAATYGAATMDRVISNPEGTGADQAAKDDYVNQTITFAYEWHTAVAVLRAG